MEKQLKFAVPQFKISMKNKNKMSEVVTIKTAIDVCTVAKSCFEKEKIEWIESFIVIAVNQGNRVMGYIKLSEGGMTGTVADPKAIFQFALLSGATGIIIAHNHPSGTLRPSTADIDLTLKIVNAARYLDMKVLDHVIVTAEGHYSMQENGDF